MALKIMRLRLGRLILITLMLALPSSGGMPLALADGPLLIPPSVPRSTTPHKPRKPRRRAIDGEDQARQGKKEGVGTTENTDQEAQRGNVDAPRKENAKGSVGGTILSGGSRAPFKNPQELYGRIRKDLGLESASRDAVAAVEGVDDLQGKWDALLATYRASTDGEKKRDLLKQMKELKLDIEMRRHVNPLPDFALRRRAFIGDVLDALVALQVANVDASWRTIFQCNFTEMQAGFLEVLKAMPNEEVAPLLWERLEMQIRYSTATGEQKLTELEAAKRDLKGRIQQIRDEIRMLEEEDKKDALRVNEEDLIREIDQVEYDRLVVRAAVANRNLNFRKSAFDMLVSMGQASLKPVTQGLYSHNTSVKTVAGRILLTMGDRSVPALIEAQQRAPGIEVVRLIGTITGERIGDDPAAWQAWLAKSGKAAAENRKPEPKLIDADKPDADPLDDDITIGFRPGVTEIESLKKELASARQSREEASLLRRALESKLNDLNPEVDEEETESGDRMTTADLRTALDDVRKREQHAKEREDKSLDGLLKLLEGKRMPEKEQVEKDEEE